MSDFLLPTNIKQIGSIGDGLRIYVEDYVCTYLFQYAESGGYDERIALLIGRFMVIDGQSILFINGAIQGKYTEEKDGLLCFTEKDGAYADTVIAEFFPGMEVVGWMQSQPSYGVYLNQQYAAYHMSHFTKDYQVMFVMDPCERINAFYAVSPERGALKETKGYFIYYDKNTNMHEFMLKNKNTDFKTQPPSYIELTRMEPASDGIGEARDVLHGKIDKPEEVIRRHQAERVRKRSSLEQRRTVNLLVSLSAVLFVVCFVMGAGLIQNQDRIVKMEDQLVQLSTAYKNLFVQMNPDGTASVFAAQTEGEPLSAAPENTDGSAQVIEENGGQLNSQATGETNAATPDAAGQAAEATPAPVEAAPAANTGAAVETTPPETQPVTTSPQVSVPETYTIQPGDSLIAISIQYYGDNTRVNDILALNGIENADKIISGKTILLPRP